MGSYLILLMKNKNLFFLIVLGTVLLVIAVFTHNNMKNDLSSQENSFLGYSVAILLIGILAGVGHLLFTAAGYEAAPATYASNMGYRKKNEGPSRAEIDEMQYIPRVRVVKVKNPNALIDLDCRKCGTKLKEDDAFCRKCGEKTVF